MARTKMGNVMGISLEKRGSLENHGPLTAGAGKIGENSGILPRLI
jgi:hypothetical protein